MTGQSTSIKSTEVWWSLHSWNQIYEFKFSENSALFKLLDRLILYKIIRYDPDSLLCETSKENDDKIPNEILIKFCENTFQSMTEHL